MTEGRSPNKMPTPMENATAPNMIGMLMATGVSLIRAMIQVVMQCCRHPALFIGRKILPENHQCCSCKQCKNQYINQQAETKSVFFICSHSCFLFTA